MMIRRIFSLIPGLLLLLAINGQAQENHDAAFLINGKLVQAEGEKLTLINGDSNKKVATATVKNGVFELSGTADETTIFVLQCDEKTTPMLLVAKAGDTIQIDGTLASFPVAEVKGNLQSVKMQQYQKEFMPLLKQAKSINSRAARLTPASDSAEVMALQQEADAFNSQMKSTAIAFIQYHPDALASIFVLMNAMKTIPPSAVKGLFSSLSDEVKNSTYGKMAQAAIKNTTITAIGAIAPNFTLKDVKGHPVSLASFRGKYVLIDFWASWCGPCRAENPNVVAAYNRYKQENFTILGVSLDKDKTDWTDAIQQDKLTWTQVSDLKGWNNAAARLYRVTGIPANFLIDPSGKIIAKNLRGRALERQLAAIFNQ